MENLTLGKGRIIGMVSGKGGVGKTTVTINLASAMREFGADPIVIDGDVRMAGTSLYLDMYSYPITLTEILQNKMSIFEGIYTHPSGIKVVPTSFYAEPASLFALRKILSNKFLKNHMLLIDSPPGLTEDVVNILKSCKEVIGIVTPQIQAIANTIKIMKVAEDMNVTPLGIVVNRYDKKAGYKIDEIKEIFDLPILGVIPEDRLISESIDKRIPSYSLNPNAKSSIIFKKMAASIFGIVYEERIPILKKMFKFLFRH